MNQSIFIENNEQISIKGAKRVVSSTSSQAVIDTDNSTIIISGSAIEVKKLDLESLEVVFSGKFSNIKLASLTSQKTPILKRIFK